MGETLNLINLLCRASGIRGLSQLPEYLAEYGYDNPGSNPANPTPFSYVNNTELEFFEWMASNPDKTALNEFNLAMSRSVQTKQIGLLGLPVFDELTDTNPDEVAIVDVGGGYGHLLREVRRRLPHIKGRLVVEDLPETVKGAEWITPEDNVGIQGYNFFREEQPVKGTAVFSHDGVIS